MPMSVDAAPSVSMNDVRGAEDGVFPFCNSYSVKAPPTTFNRA
jgi:hypothetical protein